MKKKIKLALIAILKLIASTSLGVWLLGLLPREKENNLLQGENVTKPQKILQVIVCKLARFNKINKQVVREVKFVYKRPFVMRLNIAEFTQCGYYFSLPNPELASLIGHGGNGFIDIGANVGMFTMLAAQTFRDVHSFEALKNTCDILNENIKLNNIDNISVHDVALSDTCGTMQLHCNPLNNGGHSLETFSSKLLNTGADFEWRVIDVEVSTMDEVLHREDSLSIDLIKIDVEGHELAVIKGGISLIESQMPAIYAEVSKDQDKVGEILNVLPGSYDAYSLVAKKEIRLCESVPDDVLFLPSTKKSILQKI